MAQQFYSIVSIRHHNEDQLALVPVGYDVSGTMVSKDGHIWCVNGAASTTIIDSQDAEFLSAHGLEPVDEVYAVAWEG